MNAGQLRDILNKVADNTPVFIPGSDHSFREVQADITTAIFDLNYRSWSEDYSYEDYPESKGQSRRKIILIS